MHHALLYTGENPAALMAAALARAAEALSPTLKRPEYHPDCHILDNEGKTVTVEQVRAWRQAAHYLPNEADCHVFIMANADDMNIPAQNALLALLEDPPTPCLFVLLCRNEDALLPTVRSRLRKNPLRTDTADMYPDEAAAWSKTVLRAIKSRDEFALLKTLLSVEKLPRADLCVYLECLLAQAYASRVPLDLTDGAFFGMMEGLRDARHMLDSNVANGSVLASLCVALNS